MSIEKRGDNSWRFDIVYKAQRYKHTFNGTEKEAKTAHDEFKVEVRKGKVLNRTVTFKQFIEIYDETRFSELSPTTQRSYGSQVQERLLPYFGKYKLQELSTLIIKRYYTKLQDAGTGSRTIKPNHHILSAILSEAVFQGYVDFNICNRIKSPSHRRQSDSNFLNIEELKDLLRVLESEPIKWQIACLLAVYSGARRTEITGLLWQNVDLDSKIIKIKQVRQSIPGKGEVIKEPKTKNSERAIPIPAALVQKLRDWREKQTLNQTLLECDYQESDYVVTNEDGSLIMPDSITHYFAKLVKTEGLKGITFHGLRHTYATLLLHSGEVSSFAIAGNLGHSDPTVHQRIYTHELPESNRNAADYFEKLLK